MSYQKAEVRVIASSANWIEGSAVQQLEKTAELPGMKLAVGLPDLHPGKGSPVGAAFVSVGRFYPTLVGNDIGCGIGLWQTALEIKALKLASAAEKLKNLDGAWDGDAGAWLKEREVSQSGFESSLGTIGSGNHFAELQSVERVEDGAAFAALGLDTNQALLCVHSGSRGLGEAILRQHVDQFAGTGLVSDSAEAAEYLQRHGQARAWAKANRELIAARFLERLKTTGERVVDLCHNSLEVLDGAYLHRKGAAPATEGAVVIPGSRGTFSYLVRPLDASEKSAFSLAHGAGRKWSRSDSKGRLEKRYRAEDLKRTSLGSYVICEDKELLYEEAPQAYKNIDVVIADMVEAGFLSDCRVAPADHIQGAAMSSLWLHITAGTGPVECCWAAQQVFLRLREEAGRRADLELELLNVEPGPAAETAQSILLALSGEGAAEFADTWKGSVQWTARSPFRLTHKRKNWFVGITVIEPPDEALFQEKEIRWEVMRASGPGGQHVNRTESAVRVTHVATGIQASASEERSQHRNRKLALARLAEKIRLSKEEQNAGKKEQLWRAHHELERGNAVKVLKP